MAVANKSCKLITSLLNDKYKSVCRSILNQVVLNAVVKNHVFNGRSVHTTTNLNAVVSFNLSDIGEGIRDVVVKEWFVKVGDKVSQFDNICEVQSDKASVTITSRYDGIINKLHHQVDQIALVGKPLLDIEIEGEETEVNKNEEQVNKHEEKTPMIEEKQSSESSDDAPSISYALCIPSVRRLAKENSINLNEITGTGKKGRILKEDVIRYLDSKSTVKSDKSEIKSRVDKTEPLRGFQRAMVKTMTEALKIPHFLYCDEIAVTKLIKLRKAVKDEAQKYDVKISLMPFFIKAASNALNRYPILNAKLDQSCESVTYCGAHNIGIAMDTKIGLAVPIIKNVDQMGVVDIAKELNRLMKSGKEGNFSPDDLKGGSFTISNIGVIGGTYASPVILPPQVAIIAIGAYKTVPRFDKFNNVVPEDILCVSGSADHRIVDGASMANFINHFKKQIEDPNLLFLNL